jgi:REP element-mobilizing transposase RayT
LQTYDYSSGVFFVTICAHQRQQIFGSVRNGNWHPSTLGYLLSDELQRLPHNFPNVLLDAYQVMPNHLHFIASIRPAGESNGCRGLASLIGSYKSAVTRKAGELGIKPAGLIWMRGFYDHVVRHERALDRIRDYITNNVMQWDLDRENAARKEDNEFYRWLESYSKLVGPPSA